MKYVRPTILASGVLIALTAIGTSKFTILDLTQATSIDVVPDHLSMTLYLLGLGVGGFIGAGAVAYIWYHGPDPDAIEHEIEENRFKEWISMGTVQYDIGDKYIEVDTLSDLVDIAIDSNTRVIHDKRRNIYAVIDGDIVYSFTPETETTTIELKPHPFSTPGSIDDDRKDHEGNGPESSRVKVQHEVRRRRVRD